VSFDGGSADAWQCGRIGLWPRPPGHWLEASSSRRRAGSIRFRRTDTCGLAWRGLRHFRRLPSCFPEPFDCAQPRLHLQAPSPSVLLLMPGSQASTWIASRRPAGAVHLPTSTLLTVSASAERRPAYKGSAGAGFFFGAMVLSTSLTGRDGGVDDCSLSVCAPAILALMREGYDSMGLSGRLDRARLSLGPLLLRAHAGDDLGPSREGRADDETAEAAASS